MAAEYLSYGRVKLMLAEMYFMRWTINDMQK